MEIRECQCRMDLPMRCRSLNGTMAAMGRIPVVWRILAECLVHVVHQALAVCRAPVAAAHRLVFLRRATSAIVVVAAVVVR